MPDILGYWIIFLVVVNGGIAVVVSSHAEKNGKDGYFWIVFFLGIIGVLLYVADMAGSDEPAPSTSEDSATSRTKGTTLHTGNVDRKKLRANSYDKNMSLEDEGSEVATSAVYDYLKHVQTAKPDYFFERIYPVYPAGIDSKEAWWEGSIAPRLRRFPGVKPPEGDSEEWRYLSQQDVSQDSHEMQKSKSKSSSGQWLTTPESDFIHQEIGEASRGLHVTVTDGEQNGKYYVNGDRAKAESHTVKAQVGEEWNTNAVTYLEGYYKNHT